MAIGWFTALKLVPWGDVIEATPQIVKGAKKLFRSTRETARKTPVPEANVPAFHDATSAAAYAAQLQARVDSLEQEQRSAAELLASLAEQNAKVVAAIDVLQKRVRLLTGACILSLGGVGILLYLR